MTILSKISEKKSEEPFVEGEHPTSPPEDVESRIMIFPTRAHRLSAATTLCLLLTALCVVGIGTLLYNEFLSVPRSRLDGSVQIPMKDDYDMNNDEDTYYSDPDKGVTKDVPDSRTVPEDLFQENFEIDDDEKYEKIDVPVFGDARKGRFIHDFNTNVTGIIDDTGRRCFVMPLDRDHVLMPESLLDLIHKMWDGYYKVDTEVVRRSMHVVVPPIQDTGSIGSFIVNECEGLPIYRLEKYQDGVVKRSAKLLHRRADFVEFAGSGIIELDLLNLDEVLAYEAEVPRLRGGDDGDAVGLRTRGI